MLGPHDRAERDRSAAHPEILLRLLRALPHALSLGKDAPRERAIQAPWTGPIVAIPQVGGLHHRYERIAA